MVAQAKAGQIESNPTPHTNQNRIISIESTLPHLATKADLERQTRLLVMWIMGLLLALFAALMHFLG